QIQDWADESSGESSEDEDYPGFRQRHRRQPWPRVSQPEGGAHAEGAAGLALGPGWGPGFVVAGNNGGAGAMAAAAAMLGELGTTTWSLRVPLCFGRINKVRAVEDVLALQKQDITVAVEQRLAQGPLVPYGPYLPEDADLCAHRSGEVHGADTEVWDPMPEEAGRWTTPRTRAPATRQAIQDNEVTVGFGVEPSTVKTGGAQLAAPERSSSDLANGPHSTSLPIHAAQAHLLGQEEAAPTGLILEASQTAFDSPARSPPPQQTVASEAKVARGAQLDAAATKNKSSGAGFPKSSSSQRKASEEVATPPDQAGLAGAERPHEEAGHLIDIRPPDAAA
ncbi:unnamed protein product, partial [Urochloa humidicola]